MRLDSLSKELLPLRVVQPPPLHQLLVTPLLLNATLADNHDLIGALDGLQPVSDDQEGLVGAPGQGLLNLPVTSPVSVRDLVLVLWKSCARAVPVGNLRCFRREHPGCW